MSDNQSHAAAEPSADAASKQGRPGRRLPWKLLISLLVAAALGVGGIWWRVGPEYRAEGQIRIRPVISGLLFKGFEPEVDGSYERFQGMQVAILRGPTVLNRVLDREDVRETLWYRQPSSGWLGWARASSTPLERLREGLAVTARSGTELVDVALCSTDRQGAATIVNAVLDEYIGYVRERADEDQSPRVISLAEEYKGLKQEIQGRQMTLSKLRKEFGAVDPDELLAGRRARVDSLEQELAKIRRESALAVWQRDQAIQNATDRQDRQAKAPPEPAAVSPAPGAGPAAAPDFEEDEIWRTRSEKVAQLKERMRIQSEGLKPTHPAMVSMLAELKAAQAMQAAREEYLRDRHGHHAAKPPSAAPATQPATPSHPAPPADPTAGSPEQLVRRAALLQRQEEMLQGDLERARRDFELAVDNAELLRKENDSLARKLTLYHAVRDRLEAMEFERRNAPVRIELFARATLPVEPARDPRWWLTACVAGLALVLGVIGTVVTRRRPARG